MAISLDEAVVARLTKGGERFEIFVDPGKALQWKRGTGVAVADVLAYPGVFRDARKAEKAPESALHKAFGTTDIIAAAQRILKEGELQLTTEQRRRMTEDKRRQIANMISRNGINPQTGAPHPADRILNVMEKAGVAVDALEPADGQVERVVKAISAELPIKMEKLEIAVRVPAQFAGRAAAAVHHMAALKKEEWLSNGDWAGVIEVPAGMSADVLQRLAKLTEGQVESKITARK